MCIVVSGAEAEAEAEGHKRHMMAAQIFRTALVTYRGSVEVSADRIRMVPCHYLSPQHI